MRKARSTCESMAQHTSPSSFCAPEDSDEYRPTPWFCPSGRLLLFGCVGCAVTRAEYGWVAGRTPGPMQRSTRDHRCNICAQLRL